MNELNKRPIEVLTVSTASEALPSEDEGFQNGSEPKLKRSVSLYDYPRKFEKCQCCSLGSYQSASQQHVACSRSKKLHIAVSLPTVSYEPRGDTKPGCSPSKDVVSLEVQKTNLQNHIVPVSVDGNISYIEEQIDARSSSESQTNSHQNHSRGEEEGSRCSGTNKVGKVKICCCLVGFILLFGFIVYGK